MLVSVPACENMNDVRTTLRFNARMQLAMGC